MYLQFNLVVQIVGAHSLVGIVQPISAEEEVAGQLLSTMYSETWNNSLVRDGPLQRS